MASVIKAYCGIRIDDEAAASGTFSKVEATWNRTVQIWDDSVNKYIFWGDTEGQLTLSNLQLTPVGGCTLQRAIASYDAAASVSIYQGRESAANLCVTLDGCYAFNLTSTTLKQVGDIYIIEGGTIYKIFL